MHLSLATSETRIEPLTYLTNALIIHKPFEGCGSTRAWGVATEYIVELCNMFVVIKWLPPSTVSSWVRKKLLHTSVTYFLQHSDSQSSDGFRLPPSSERISGSAIFLLFPVSPISAGGEFLVFQRVLNLASEEPASDLLVSKTRETAAISPSSFVMSIKAIRLRKLESRRSVFEISERSGAFACLQIRLNKDEADLINKSRSG